MLHKLAKRKAEAAISYLPTFTKYSIADIG